MMNDSQRDELLIRLDERTDQLVKDNAELKKGMYGDDGSGGLCGRISKLEAFQFTVIGIATAISLAISAGAYWVLNHLTGSH